MSWETNSVNKMLDWTFAAMDRSQQPAQQDYAEHLLTEYRRELQQVHAEYEQGDVDDLFTAGEYDQLDELADWLAGSPEPEPRLSDLREDQYGRHS